MVHPQHNTFVTFSHQTLVAWVRQVRILRRQTVSRGVRQFKRTEAAVEGLDGVGPPSCVDGSIPGLGEGEDPVLLPGPGGGMEGGPQVWPHGGCFWKY